MKKREFVSPDAGRVAAAEAEFSVYMFDARVDEVFPWNADGMNDLVRKVWLRTDSGGGGPSISRISFRVSFDAAGKIVSAAASDRNGNPVGQRGMSDGSDASLEAKLRQGQVGGMDPSRLAMADAEYAAYDFGTDVVEDYSWKAGEGDSLVRVVNLFDRLIPSALFRVSFGPDGKVVEAIARDGHGRQVGHRRPVKSPEIRPWKVCPLQADQGESIAIQDLNGDILAIIPPDRSPEAADKLAEIRKTDLKNATLMAAAPVLAAKIDKAIDFIARLPAHGAGLPGAADLLQELQEARTLAHTPPDIPDPALPPPRMS